MTVFTHRGEQARVNRSPAPLLRRTHRLFLAGRNRPAKMLERRKKILSTSFSRRSTLHAMVAAAAIADDARRPAPGRWRTANRSSSRSRIADGDSTTVLAAASPMASGRPSVPPQMAATAACLMRRVDSRAEWPAACSTNKVTASPSSRTSSISRGATRQAEADELYDFAGDVERLPARRKDAQ